MILQRVVMLYKCIAKWHKCSVFHTDNGCFSVSESCNGASDFGYSHPEEFYFSSEGNVSSSFASMVGYSDSIMQKRYKLNV